MDSHYLDFDIALNFKPACYAKNDLVYVVYYYKPLIY